MKRPTPYLNKIKTIMVLHTLLAFLTAFIFPAGALLAAPATSGGFLNEFTVPLLAKPPAIDGAFVAEDWRGALGFEGLVHATGERPGMLDQRAARTYLGATADAFYIAIVSELPDGGVPLVTNIKTDIMKVAFDDSFEIWIDPDPANAKSTGFQAIFNSIGKGVYLANARGGAPLLPDWNGKYEMKNSFTKDRWVTQIRIPLEAVAPGRKSTEGVWGIAINRNWKEPWAQTSSPGAFTGHNVRVTFTDSPGVAVSMEQLKDPLLRDIETKLSVYNPSAVELTVKARIDLERNTMFALKKEAELKVAPGATESITFAQNEENSTALDQIATVTSADGKTVYYKRKISWREPRERRWDTTPVVKLPVDFQFSHYPYKKKLRLIADISGLPKDAKLDQLKIRISPQGSETIIKEAVITSFDKNGQSEISIDLPELSDGTYAITAKAEGQNVPTDSMMKTFVRKNYPWEHNPMGRSTKVYPPFTPIEVQDKTLSTVLRTHQLNDLGLLDQVNAKGKDLLAAPMSFQARVDGMEVPVSATPIQFASKQDHEVVTQSNLQAGALKASVKSTWDYDGTVKVQLTLDSSGGKMVDALSLDIPLDDSQAPFIHAMSDALRKGPITERLAAGEGVVWDAKKLIAGELPLGFCSYIFLGSGHRGLSWFAENDKNWSWDRTTPNLEVVRKGKTLNLRVHLINKPVVIEKPRTITFGLLAAPVKPMLFSKRTFAADNKIDLLLTCINWLAGPGICGNVYPVGNDPYFWEILARGNVESLSKEEIKAAEERGNPYFEPFGEDALKSWKRHVDRTLGGRVLGKQMILYYNRATSASAYEFPTFKDEWLLKEMTGHDFKITAMEQKLVPSESYIDYALYWYKKSFELGRNTGVYWDNWFLAPSYNLEMTDAYRDESGAIIPATGIWGLRELCKRTFIMMNEEGMEPRTFPHMTSTSILPMLSFATMQLDWEWQVGAGDTQDRFSREYLQVATAGDLAGVFSWPLRNHGFKDDDITGLRSYTGVPMLYNVHFYSVFPSSAKVPEWDKFIAGLRDQLRKPGLKTWRYWDEETQPVTTGDADLPVIVHSVPGDETWVVLCGYAKEDRKAKITIDPKRLGLGKDYTVTNVENGVTYPVKDNIISLDVPKHAVIGLKIK
jgi:hypothetical protein